MNVSIPESALTALVSRTILDGLDQKTKEDLLMGAIQSLLEKDNSRYGDNMSPIQRAYRQAAESVAKKVMTEKLEKDEKFRTELEKIFTDSVQRVFVGDKREKVVDKIASNFAAFLAKDLY